MAAVLTHSQSEHFGLRPMNPMKDLRDVANLIEEAFASELALLGVRDCSGCEIGLSDAVRAYLSKNHLGVGV